MSRTGRPRVPWWAWPSVLCLDAPAVAVAWSLATTHLAGASPRASAFAFVATATAGAYLLDRWRDARRLDGTREAPLRHAWTAVRPAWTGAAAGLALAAAGALAFTLPRASLGLAGVVAAVTAAVVIVPGVGAAGRSRARRAWRPWVVGVGFALGAAIPAATAPLARVAPVTVALAALVALNVAMIAAWEAHLDDGSAPAPEAAGRRTGARVRVGAGLALAAASLAASPWLLGAGPPVASAAVALAALEGAWPAEAPLTARHLAADAVVGVAALLALLTPGA